MADAPGWSDRQAAAAASDGLLATKLYPPRLRTRFVSRTRLITQLDNAREAGVILVAAPAGFGKSTLLSDWAHRSDRAVAWLTLDRGDTDPARFWRHLGTTLDGIQAGIAESSRHSLGPPPPSSYEGYVSALLNQLDPTNEIVLVLDDYDRIQSEAVHGALAFLVEHRPVGLQVILASRADPLLPLARWRARGELVEMRAAELKCTFSEAAQLLRAAVDTDLPDAAIAALEERTEGWPAGLQLAALSLRGQPDWKRFMESFGASHRYVLDYLTDEVLEDQPQEMREFLVETSVLDKLSGPLCDAVTGRDDGQQTLEAIERANLFLVPLDDVRGWWRYHHLFAELLRSRLEQQWPGRVNELHRAAALWCDGHGLADEAVGHALETGDSAWVVRLIERHAGERLLRGEGATLRRWLAAVPDPLVQTRPRLLLAKANLAFLSGDIDPFEAPLRAARTAIAASPALADEPFEPVGGGGPSLIANVPASIALGRAHVAELRGNGDATHAFAEQAKSLLAEDEWMLGILVQAHLALGDLLRGRLAEAERAFAVEVEKARAAGERLLVARGWAFQAQVQRARGRLDAALDTYRQALAMMAPPGAAAEPGAGLMLVGLAEVAYERDNLDVALDHVTEGNELCRQLADAITGAPQPLANGLATLAWVRHATGDVAGAREAMEEAAVVAPGDDGTSLLNPVPARRARLLLVNGDVEWAAQWTADLGLDPDDEPHYTREAEYLVLARVLLVHDQLAPALALLDRLYRLASRQRRTASRIEIQALRALAQDASGQTSRAIRTLGAAATLAHRQGYMRVFLDEGPPMASLVARLIAAHRSTPAVAPHLPLVYVGRLARSFESDAEVSGGRASTTGPGLVEHLSQREREVLQLLAAGRPNREIAGELYVTLDTVKKHVTHILEKLGATNRTEAVSRARSLGLIE